MCIILFAYQYFLEITSHSRTHSINFRSDRATLVICLLQDKFISWWESHYWWDHLCSQRIEMQAELIYRKPSAMTSQGGFHCVSSDKKREKNGGRDSRETIHSGQWLYDASILFTLKNISFIIVINTTINLRIVQSET